LQPNNKIEAVDFLKGYSILSIVIFHFFQGIHYGPLFARLINFGGTGIHPFIFASGFGLYLSHLKKPLKSVPFFKKRFSKIYIPYIIIVLASALISILIPIYANSWYAVFGHVFLYKMFDENIEGSYGYQLWFISTIIQFYLFFPLIIWLRERFPGGKILAVGLAISLGWALGIVLLHLEGLRIWNSFFLQFLWEFILGMYCAERFQLKNFRFWQISKLNLLLITIAGLSLYGLMALYGGDFGKQLNDVPAFFGYTSLCLLIYAFQIGWLNRWILFTASISYSLFLIHFLVINLVLAFTNAIHLPYTAVLLVPMLAICYLVSVPLEIFFGLLINRLQSPGASINGKQTPSRHE